MPNTSRGYTYPDSSGHDRIWEHIQELATDVNTDIDAVAAKTTAKPIGRLIQTVSQNLTDEVFTAVTFGSGSEVFDTGNFHNEVTNNTRVTPTVAGYYRFSGTGYLTNRPDMTTFTAGVRKNGTTILEGPGRSTPGSAVNGVAYSSLVYMNGTTDYIELVVQQDNTTTSISSTRVSSYFTSTLEWEFIRS